MPSRQPAASWRYIETAFSDSLFAVFTRLHEIARTLPRITEVWQFYSGVHSGIFPIGQQLPNGILLGFAKIY
jgi:hypothetical protein